VILAAPELEPRHWGLSAEERRDRGRRFAALSAFVALLFHTAFTVPTGILWPLLTFTCLMTLVLLPLWVIGFVHAIGHVQRREPGPAGSAARVALVWWSFPLLVGPVTWFAIDSGLPHAASIRILAAHLDELAREAEAAPATFEVLDRMFVGPYPCRDVRRYPTHAVRFEFTGAGALEGARGLVHLPDGVALPVGLTATGPAVHANWVPWLEERP
jgi:hypothetical protein